MPSGSLIGLQPPSNLTIIMVGVALASLFVVAGMMDRMRRRRIHAQRLTNDWRAFHDIAEEKGLNKKEIALLEAMVKRWSADTPVRPVTMRREFNACVDKEMARVAKESAAEYAHTGKTLREIRERLSFDHVPLGQRAENTRDIGPGQLINIGREKGEARRFIPFATVAVDEAYLFLRPLSDGMHPPDSYPRGTLLPCRIWREDDARYTFSLRFDDIVKPDNLWRFNHALQIKRHQAREHFRVTYNETIKVDVVAAPINGDFSDIAQRPATTHLEGRVTSLSGGGLAVRLPEPISRHVVLRMNLALDGQEDVLVHCAIVSVHGQERGGSAVRCRFVEMSEEAQDAIAFYVNQRQQPQLSSKSNRSEA